ncbi:S-adenosyl-L-methionine-dependent methyltransferase [Apodospora peruviana]|uniref:S-adenosyl-L-methionine-dependent methyltransferase n=1 Tax=Apodospora peruviana TaxID=516989 RepID=A0AAE0I051_9PEZI|nr:S-adenosyl-L-methionine-dependent methyltransferase [Apodospora peruviana]
MTIDINTFSSDDDGSSTEAASNSDSASLTSVIHQHVSYRGRQYNLHQIERYPLPSDGMERDREDMTHLMMLEATEEKYFLSHIGDCPRKIIDLGTGTGIWAVEVGDLYPDAAVTGVDLRPIQAHWTPPNVNFVVDDIEEEWLNGGNFDLIHARHVCPFIKQPAALVTKAFDNLKPDGWIEIQDLDYITFSDDHTSGKSQNNPIDQFLDLATDIWAKLDTDMRIAPKLGSVLQEAGFENVSCTTYKVPIGTWPDDQKLKSLGKYLQIILDMLIPAICLNPTVPPPGWDETENRAFIERCRRSLKDGSVQSYMQFCFWTGQKPV